MIRKSAVELKEIIISIFLEAGVPKKVASRVADHLVNANLIGVDSHGVVRIPSYITWIKDGTIDPNAKMEIIKETDLMVLIDANKSFGQVAAYEASKIAIKKGKSRGMSLVSAKNSSHIGRLGEYAEEVVKNDLIGLIMANGQGSGQLVAPWGGKERRLSANPMAWGIPTGKEKNPFILDFSTSVVAEGKIIIYKNLNKKIPEGWVINFKGEPTTNPNDLYGPPKGSILPMAGYKGFGLSMVIDILTGALSGGGCSREDIKDVKKFYNSFTIITIDPAQIVDYPDFLKSVNNLIKYVKSSKPIKENDEILVPNELENKKKEKNLLNGIEIEDSIWEEILSVAKGLGLTL
ncbi:MAG: Ldh family oxidoreductase [Caldisericia bacterium]|nr:Ldh family oxidoreductase [Caldisericia bacterium]